MSLHDQRIILIFTQGAESENFHTNGKKYKEAGRKHRHELTQSKNNSDFQSRR